MPGPLSPDALKAYANPAYLSQTAPAAAPSSDGPNWMRRVGLPVMGGGQAADAVTTMLALHRPNTSEGNSLLYGAHPSDARVLAVKAAIDVPLAILLDRLYAHAPPGSGTRKAALLAALGFGGIGAGAAIHNAGAGK